MILTPVETHLVAYLQDPQTTKPKQNRPTKFLLTR